MAWRRRDDAGRGLLRSMKGTRSLCFALLLAILLALTHLGHAAPAFADDEPPLTRRVALQTGWNLLGWSGAASPFPAAAAGTAVLAAFTYDAAAQRYAAYHAALPARLNSLAALPSGSALWLQAPGPGLWAQPAALTGPRAVQLQRGFNLVTWTGPNRMAAGDTFSPLGERLLVAYRFDAAQQRFRSYAPTLPAFLNDLALVDYGDALWLKMEAPALWRQPSPLLFRCNPFPDLTARFDGAWRELRVAAVTVHYRADSTAERYRHAIAAAAQAELREAERRLALSADAPLQVRVHETPQAARAVTGNEFATLAHPLESTIDVLCGSAGADRTDLPDLRHEIAHVLSVRAHGFTSFFLAEGLAGWVEGRIGRQSLADWAVHAQTLALPPLSAILDDDGYFATRPLVNAFVASALLVHYLLEQQGSLEPFWDLWRLARTEREAAPQRIYGRTWRELDADYRSFFGIDAPAS